MSIFDPPWLRLHHRLCDEYEHIAFQDHAQNPDKDIDVKGVVARVIEKHLNLILPDARKLADDLYEKFLDFPLKSAIEEALRKQKPDLPDQGVEDIFQVVKGKFLDTQYEYIYFIYFVISYFIATGGYTITRGDQSRNLLLQCHTSGQEPGVLPLSIPDASGSRRNRPRAKVQNNERNALVEA